MWIFWEFLYFFSVMEVLYFLITTTVDWQLSLCVYVCCVFYRRIIRFGINLFFSHICHVKTVFLFLDSIDPVGTNTKLLSQGAYLRAFTLGFAHLFLPILLQLSAWLGQWSLLWPLYSAAVVYFCWWNQYVESQFLYLSFLEPFPFKQRQLFLPYTFKKKNVSKRPKLN